jgi:hypothetical protein
LHGGGNQVLLKRVVAGVMFLAVAKIPEFRRRKNKIRAMRNRN